MGQFYGFVVEVAFIALLLILKHVEQIASSPTSAYFIEVMAFTSHFINFGVLSAVEVLTSPALRANNY